MDAASLALEPVGAALLIAAVVLLGAAVVALARGIVRARASGMPMTSRSTGLVLLLVVLAVIAVAYGWAALFGVPAGVGD